MKKVVLNSFLIAASVLFFALNAVATPVSIIKVGLGESAVSTPDLAVIGGVLGTVSEADSSVFGAQDTNVDFIGFLSGMTDIISGAEFTIADVALDGAVNLIPLSGSVTAVNQATDGGTFELKDDGGNVLLTGALDKGLISGAVGSTTGSFFNTTVATFTGGSLLAYVSSVPAGLSFSLTSIESGALSGLQYGCDNQELCTLSDFNSVATGNIEGAEVPEPFTAGLLLTGLGAGALIRKRSA